MHHSNGCDNGRKLRIAHVVDCFGAGGIATGVLELIQATNGAIHHRIISLSDDVRLLAQLPVKPPIHVIKPGLTRLLGFSSRLAWLVWRHRIDILHCNNAFAWLDASLVSRLTGCLCLQTFHGVEKPLGQEEVRMKYRLAGRLSTAVTAVGEASKRMVCALSGLAPADVEVIANGIDLNRYHPSAADAPGRSALRRELGVAPGTDLVIHVGGLRRIKDQATLLRAWRLVLQARKQQSGSEPLLLIAGEGPCREELDSLARELDIASHIRFLGQRRDLEALLPACDLFVLSSLSEGLSFAVLEAMAAGLPVVATRVGGNGELVQHGESGLMVPAQDPEALGEALGRLLEKPMTRREMGKQGRTIAEQRYDAAKAAARYVALYQRLMETRLRKRVGLLCRNSG